MQEIIEPTILIVDDVPDNILIASAALEKNGYQVITADAGQKALDLVAKEAVDLILLDIMMPEMDGFQVGRQLKKQEKTKDIPIIFLTALTDVESVVKGFEIGGVDYITKPFNVKELVVRVNTHIELRQLQRSVLEQNQKLIKNNEQIESQYKELRTLSYNMSVDIKKPLTTIGGFVKLLHKDIAALKDPHVEMFLEQLDLARRKACGALDYLLLMADAYSQPYTPQELDMKEIVLEIQAEMQEAIQQKKAEMRIPDEWPPVWGHPLWVKKIWEIYLQNALRYGGRPPRIDLGCAQEEEQVKFWINDNGPGLIAEERAKLGDARISLLNDDNQEPDVERVREGYGLELSVVQRLCERQGGYAGLAPPLSGGGNCFYFTLPANTEASLIARYISP